MAVASALLPDDVGMVKLEDDQHDCKPALTPPTSESTGKREVDDSGSELSDLEPEPEPEEKVRQPPLAQKKEEDDDDNTEIVPDHYYEGGEVPVFKPTMKQFRSFKDFIRRIDKYGMRSGIVKVIPPQEWRDALPPLDEQVKTIKVKNPITQEFHGTRGTYTQANIEKQRSYNLPQWKAVCEESSNQPPAKRGESRRNQDKPTRLASTRVRNAPVAGNPPKRKGPGRPRVRPLPTTVHKHDEGDESAEESRGTITPLTPTSPPSKPTKAKKEQPKGTGTSIEKPKGRQPKAGQAKSVSSRRQHNRQDQTDIIDEEAFRDFDYRVHDQEQWTTERIQDLEKTYWKSLNFSNPMYGADMPGSLFTDETKNWNVAKLENLLDVLGQNVPGVNTAYLYLGMWKASFAWHLEDVDLYSINYIHFGAPKQWYSISQKYARKFEAAMRSVWPNDSKNCDQFLRHKTYLISPQLLEKEKQIPVNRLVHNEGEFVITFPYGYHSGYNLGYNCAESVNFATESWLDYGRIAKKCNCEADSVWVDVREIERKLRGEPTPEYYEETDDEDDEDEPDEPSTLPTPPGSVKGKPKRSHKKKKENEKGSKPKIKKLRIKIKAPLFEPCVLCPSDNKYEKLLPTDDGRQAHRRCALYTPETYISEENGQETICDISRIDKARLELKCYYCKNKKGSVFQCSQKKCTRAYHATCAAQAGILVDIGLVPVFGEDGTEYTDTGIDFRCRIHRGRRGKHVDGSVLEENPLIRKSAIKLPVGEVAQFQFLQGDIFAGVILENRKSEQTFLIEVLPKGEKFEVEYKWLLVFDPVNSQLPMPSDNAKPLPLELARKSRTTAEDPAIKEGPKPNELFCDSALYRWEEFDTCKAFRNPSQVNVDLSKPKKLWYYLGRTSTEAKAQYTGDLAVRRNDPTANFLETVRLASIAAAVPVQRKPMAVSYPSANNQHGTNAPPPYNQPQYSRLTTNAQSKPPPTPERPYNGKYAITDPVHPNYQYKPRIGYNVDSQALHRQNAFTQAGSVQSPHNSHYGHAHGNSLGHAQQSNYRAPQAPMASPAPMAPMMSAQPKIPQAFHGTPEYRPGSNHAEDTYRNSTHNYQRPVPYQLPQSRTHTQAHAGQRESRPPPLQTSYSRPQAPVANMVGSIPKALDPTFDQDSSSRPPSVTRLSATMSPPLTPDAAAAPAQEIKGVSFLNIPEKYKYFHEAEKARPKVYQSPYAPDGGFTSHYLPLPATTPKSRPRGPSISQDYLMKRTPSQQEAVTRQIHEDRARLRHEAHEAAKLHERRQAQLRQKEQYNNAHSRQNSLQSPYGQPTPQHLPLSAFQHSQPSYVAHSPQPYHNPYADTNAYQNYHQFSPSYSNRPNSSHQYQQLQNYQQPHQHQPYHPHSPTYPIHHHHHQQGPASPEGLQFQSPQEFQLQMQREASQQSPHVGTYDHFFREMRGAAGGGYGYNGGGAGGEGSNRQGSPLAFEMAGGGGAEMLPVMREGSRY